MKTTLVIFSGLPGTGKTALANLAASTLKMPLLRIDDIVASIPNAMRIHANPFWDDMIGILLSLVGAQLELGISVMVDSVFMGADRMQAHELAIRNEAAFRPIHTYVSDEAIWRERVTCRAEASPPEDNVATWETIQEQRKAFWPWKEGSALFVDAIYPVESNLERVVEYITAADVELKPL